MEHEIGDPVTGATCRMFARNKPRPDLPGWQNNGECYRDPVPVGKHPDSWCRSHEPRPGLASADPAAA